jgi:glycosyltransferase involved in cell wall biosynthesis
MAPELRIPSDGDSDAVDCSLVVEWENAQHIDTQGPLRMLASLAQQVGDEIRARGRRFELIVARDPDDATEAEVRAALNMSWSPVLAQVPVRFLAVPRCGYYALKNRAACLARGELLVFVDCDVQPQPGWLAHILEPLADPAVGVSQGATVVQPRGRWQTALGLAWLFPLQRRDGTSSDGDRVVANNIGFRRTVFLQHPYPDLITWRGQCTTQRHALERAGVGIVWAQQAITVHPFPVGVGGVIERAFLNGHDHITRYELDGGRRGDWRASYWRFRSFLRRAQARRLKLHDELATPPSARLCLLAAAAYWGCAFFSEAMVHLAPRFWRAQLRELPTQAPSGMGALTSPLGRK